MWWYNILGDNKGRISHILRIDPINAGSILCTDNLVALKRENYEPILIVNITEWRKFIDYFGLIIEANPFKVGKLKVHFFRIGSIPSTSSVNTHMGYKQFNLEPPKLRLYQLTKNLAVKILPHVSYALRYLGVIFDKYIISISPILAGADHAVTSD